MIPNCETLVATYFDRRLEQTCCNLTNGIEIRNNLKNLRKCLDITTFSKELDNYTFNDKDKQTAFLIFEEFMKKLPDMFPKYKVSLVCSYINILNEYHQVLIERKYDPYTVRSFMQMLHYRNFKRFIRDFVFERNQQLECFYIFKHLYSKTLKKQVTNEIKNYKKRSGKHQHYYWGNLNKPYSTFQFGYGYISEALRKNMEGIRPTLIFQGKTCSSDFNIDFKIVVGFPTDKIKTTIDKDRHYCKMLICHEYIRLFIYSESKVLVKTFCFQIHASMWRYAGFLIWAYFISEFNDKISNLARDLNKYFPFFGIVGFTSK